MNDYLKDLKKKEKFVIKCAKCQTEDPKEPKYCYQCKKLYCVKCCDYHSQLSNLVSDNNEGNKDDDVNKLIGHKVIEIDKVDFYCILHQKEKFIGFCTKCLLNYCSKCEEEKLHQNHEVKLFAPLLIDKKKKELIKEGKKLSQNKIDYNHKVSKKIRKKIKNDENKKQIETLSKENEKINETILELFDFLYDIYEKTKHKNYSIIYNVNNNINFNSDKLKFEKGKHEEEDAIHLIEYLKTDFILHNEETMKKAEQRKQEEAKKQKSKEANNGAVVTIHDGQLYDEKYDDSEGEEDKKEEKKDINKEEKKDIKKEEKKDIKKEEKKEIKKEEKKDIKKEEKKDIKKEEKKEEKKEKKKEEKKEDKKVNEINILKQIDHPNVVKIFEFNVILFCSQS